MQLFRNPDIIGVVLFLDSSCVTILEEVAKITLATSWG
jgi:hypothetical protein